MTRTKREAQKDRGEKKPDRIFKVKSFWRWAKEEAIRDTDLVEAVKEMRSGLVDARLGGGVCKKRIGCGGKGKRSGSRTIYWRFDNGQY